MPAIKSGTVLVSGASGFIAAWICQRLLEEGYSVRGTVRSNGKGEYLTKLFENYGKKFEYVVVEDVQKDGAFDEAVKGVDAVEHTASPFHLKAGDPEEMLGPSIRGTVGILDSTLKHAPQVKRVVITSSMAAVSDQDHPLPFTFTEENWNDSSEVRLKKLGADAPQIDKYRGSKAMAERAAWKWIDDHKSEIGFDLVTVNPPFVFGPIIHEVPSVDKLNTSVNNFYQVLKGSKTDDELAASAGNWVDVRDVAQAHTRALQVEEAGGNRFITSAGAFTMQDLLDYLDVPEFSDVRKGKPGSGKNTEHKLLIDTSKVQRVLGLKYTSLADSAKDMTSSIREKGWL